MITGLTCPDGFSIRMRLNQPGCAPIEDRSSGFPYTVYWEDETGAVHFHHVQRIQCARIALKEAQHLSRQPDVVRVYIDSAARGAGTSRAGLSTAAQAYALGQTQGLPWAEVASRLNCDCGQVTAAARAYANRNDLLWRTRRRGGALPPMTTDA